MHCISSEVVLARFGRPSESCFEQRQGSRRIAARAQLPAALEVDADPGGRARAGEPPCLLQQLLARVEVAPQSFDSRELSQHLGPAGVV